MKQTIGVLALFLCCVMHSAYACSLVTPVPVEPDPSLAEPGEVAPQAPAVTIKGIHRGHGDDLADSCSDLGVVTLAIPVTPESKQLLYSFQTVSGTAEDTIFQHGPSSGLEMDGELVFVFPWLDGAHQEQEPLNLTVRVTAYRKSGQVGGHKDLVIAQHGR